jgi:hypothetical protein
MANRESLFRGGCVVRAASVTMSCETKERGVHTCTPRRKVFHSRAVELSARATGSEAAVLVFSVS